VKEDRRREGGSFLLPLKSKWMCHCRRCVPKSKDQTSRCGAFEVVRYPSFLTKVTHCLVKEKDCLCFLSLPLFKRKRKELSVSSALLFKGNLGAKLLPPLLDSS
jgi:hypothetical protein